MVLPACGILPATARACRGAACQGGIGDAQHAQAGHAADAHHAKPLAQLRLGFQGDAVRQALAVHACGNRPAIGKAAQPIGPAQGAQREGVVRPAGAQQLPVHIERNGCLDLTPKGVGGHYRGRAGTADHRKLAQRERPGGHAVAGGLEAVDEQVHGRRQGGLAGELGQGIGDEVGAHAEVARPLHAGHAHGGGPGQRVRHQVSVGGLRGPGVVHARPARVVAYVAAACAAGMQADDAGVGGYAAGIEVALFGPQRGERLRARVARVEVIVEQHAAAGDAGGCFLGRLVGQALHGKPLCGHRQAQPLAQGVVVGRDAGQRIHRDPGARGLAVLHMHLAQGLRFDLEMGAALQHFHQRPGRLAVDLDIEVQHHGLRGCIRRRGRRRISARRKLRRKEGTEHQGAARAGQEARAFIAVHGEPGFQPR